MEQSRFRVTAIVADLITPLIAAIGGQPNFASLTFTVHGSTFKYGALINALLSFLIIAAVVYYLIVAPMARITARFQRNAEVTTRAALGEAATLQPAPAARQHSSRASPSSSRAGRLLSPERT